MSLRTFASVLALAASSLLALSEAQAQSRRNNRDSSFGSQSGFGGNQSGFGGQSGGRSTGGFGGSQQGSPFGGSGMGAGGMGMGGPGQMGGSQLDPRAQAGGMAQGTTDQGGFVGGDAQDMRSAFENMGGRQRRRVMFDFMLENLNQMRDRRAERDARRREPDLVRVQLRPPVNMTPIDSQQVSVTMQTNITRSLELQRLPAPQIQLNGRIATVSGAVASDHEAAVIAKMVSMQPGVSQVENRLTVDSSAVAPTDPSAVAPTGPSAVAPKSVEIAPAQVPPRSDQ